MSIGLLFGSFNPIHMGHIMIASYVLEFTTVEQVWLVVSPHNPLKDRRTLATNAHRLAMAKLAVKPYEPKIQVCDAEMSMELPSYTFMTLKKLSELFPKHFFTTIMGADSLSTIELWKDYDQILGYDKLMVYPRAGFDLNPLKIKYPFTAIAAPIIEISSTFIRQSVGEGKAMEAFLPPGVSAYIHSHKLYSR